MSNTVEVNIVGSESVSKEIEKVNAALATLKDKTVKVKVDVDDLKGKVDKAVDGYNKGAAKKALRLNVHQKELDKSVRDAVDDAIEKNSSKTITIKANTKDAEKDLAQLKGFLDGLSTDDVNIDVDVDVEEAIARLAELKALIASVDGKTANINVRVNSNKLTDSINDGVRDYNSNDRRIRAQVPVNKNKFKSSLDEAVRHYNDDTSPKSTAIIKANVDVDRGAFNDNLNGAIDSAKKLHKVKVQVHKDVFYDSINDAVKGYNDGNARGGKTKVVVDVDSDFVGGDRIGDKTYEINAVVDIDSLEESLNKVFSKKRRIPVELDIDDKDIDSLARRVGGDKDVFKDSKDSLNHIKKTMKELDPDRWNKLSQQDKDLVSRYPNLDFDANYREGKKQLEQMEDMYTFLRKFNRQDRDIMIRNDILPDANYVEGRDQLEQMEDMYKFIRKFNKVDRDLMIRYGILPDANYREGGERGLDFLSQRFDETRRYVVHPVMDIDKSELRRQTEQLRDSINDAVGIDEDNIHVQKRVLVDYDYFTHQPINLSDDAKKFIGDTSDMMEQTINVIQKYNIKNDRANYRDQIQKAISEASKPIEVDQTVFVDVDTVVRDRADLSRAIAALGNNEYITRRVTIRDIYDHDSTDIGSIQKLTRRIGNDFRDMGRAIRGADADSALSSMTTHLHGVSRGMSNVTRRIPVVGAFFKVFDSMGGIFQSMDTGGRALQQMGGTLPKIAGTALRTAGALGSMATSALAVATGVQLLSAVGVVGTGAIAAGAVVAQAALAGIVGVSSLVAGAIGGVAAAPFIYFAAQSEEVKQAYKELGTNVSDAMKEISKPVQPALVRMAGSLKSAFDQMRPSMERVSQGTADLIDDLGAKLPAIAKSLGPAMEKAFTSGAKHLNVIGDAMPAIVDSFGNLMERMGSGEVMKATRTFWEGLPKWIDRAGGALEGAAGAFNGINEFMSGDKTAAFREGMSEFFTEMKGTNWDGLTTALGGAMNAFGSFMGSIDGDTLSNIGENFANGFSSLTKAAEDGHLMTFVEGLSGAFGLLGDAVEGIAKPMGWLAEKFNLGGINDRKREVAELHGALDDLNTSPLGDNLLKNDANFRSSVNQLRASIEDAIDLSPEVTQGLNDSVNNIKNNLQHVEPFDAQRMLDNTNATLRASLEIDNEALDRSITQLNSKITEESGDFRPGNLAKILDAQNLTLEAAVKIDAGSAISLSDSLQRVIEQEPTLDQGVFDSMLASYDATVNASLQVDDSAIQAALAANYALSVQLTPQLGDTGEAMGLNKAIEISAMIIPKLAETDPIAALGFANKVNKIMVDMQVALTNSDFGGVEAQLQNLVKEINAQIELHPEWNLQPLPVPEITGKPTLPEPPSDKLPIEGIIDGVQTPSDPVNVPTTTDVDGVTTALDALKPIPAENVLTDERPRPIDVPITAKFTPDTEKTLQEKFPEIDLPVPDFRNNVPDIEKYRDTLQSMGWDQLLPQNLKLPNMQNFGPVTVPGQIEFDGIRKPKEMETIQAKVEYTDTGFKPKEVPNIQAKVQYNDEGFKPKTMQTVEVNVAYKDSGGFEKTKQMQSQTVEVIPQVAQGFTIPAMTVIVIPQLQGGALVLPPATVIVIPQVQGGMITLPPATLPVIPQISQMPQIPNSFSTHMINVTVGQYTLPGNSNSTHTIDVVVGDYTLPGNSSSTHTINVAVNGGGLAGGKISKSTAPASGFGSIAGFGGDIPGLSGASGAGGDIGIKIDEASIRKAGEQAGAAYGEGFSKGMEKTATKGADKAMDKMDEKLDNRLQNYKPPRDSQNKVPLLPGVIWDLQGRPTFEDLEMGGGDWDPITNAKEFRAVADNWYREFQAYASSKGLQQMLSDRRNTHLGLPLKPVIEDFEFSKEDVQAFKEDLEMNAKNAERIAEGLEPIPYNPQFSLDLGRKFTEEERRAYGNAENPGPLYRQFREEQIADMEKANRAIANQKAMGIPWLADMFYVPPIAGTRVAAANDKTIKGVVDHARVTGEKEVQKGNILEGLFTAPVGNLSDLESRTSDMMAGVTTAINNSLAGIDTSGLQNLGMGDPAAMGAQMATGLQTAMSAMQTSMNSILPTMDGIGGQIAQSVQSAFDSLRNVAPMDLNIQSNANQVLNDIQQMAGQIIQPHMDVLTNIPEVQAALDALDGTTTESEHNVNMNVGNGAGGGKPAGFGGIGGFAGMAGFGSAGASGGNFAERLTNLGEAIASALFKGFENVDLGDRFSSWWGKLWGGFGSSASISVYKDGELISKSLAQGIRSGDKYIVRALDGATGDMVFTMPKIAPRDKEELFGDLFNFDGLGFKFNLGDWSSIFGFRATHMSAGYLNEYGQMVVYTVNDNSVFNNNFDGGLVGDPEKQAKRVIDVLSSAHQGRKFQMVLGNRGV